MWSLGALVLTAWLGEPLDAAGMPALSVDVAPALRCPRASAVMDALETQLAPMRVVRASEGREHFHLTVRPYGDRGVALTLRERTTLLVDRTISVPDQACDGLAQAVALIAVTWTKPSRSPKGASSDAPPVPPPADPPPNESPHNEPPRNERPRSAPPASEPPRAESPRSDDADRPTPPSPRPVDRPGSVDRPAVVPSKLPARADDEPVREEVVHAEPVEVPVLPADQAPPAPVASVERVRVRRPASPRARRTIRIEQLRLEAAAGTTLSLARPILPTVTGGLGVEAASGRFLIGARGYVEMARTIDPADAISLRRGQAELTLGAALLRAGDWYGAALAGVGVDMIAARAKNHERGGVMRSASPIGTLALRAGLCPHSRLDVFAAAALVIGFRRERFVSDGEPLAQTARARTRLLIGVSWHVF